MPVRGVLALVVAGGLVLSSTASTAHEARKVNAQQRVFSKHQSPDRSRAKVQIRVTNRRFTAIPRLACETIISDRWTHAVTGEVREFGEDWFLVIRNVPPRTRLHSRKDVIFVSHPELAADPSWLPQGVTVRTRHCHR
jgi:nitrogen fixation protein